MRSTILLTAIAVFAAAGLAQELAEYSSWMKTVPPTVAAIRMAADNDAADATKLADTFDKVATYWKAKDPAAATLAETARDAAKAIAGGGDKASNLMKIQGVCGGCHSQHREGSAGNFKIK
jgi:hypothetical protein